MSLANEFAYQHAGTIGVGNSDKGTVTDELHRSETGLDGGEQVVVRGFGLRSISDWRRLAVAVVAISNGRPYRDQLAIGQGPYRPSPFAPGILGRRRGIG